MPTDPNLERLLRQLLTAIGDLGQRIDDLASAVGAGGGPGTRPPRPGPQPPPPQPPGPPPPTGGGTDAIERAVRSVSDALGIVRYGGFSVGSAFSALADIATRTVGRFGQLGVAVGMVTELLNKTAGAPIAAQIESMRELVERGIYLRRGFDSLNTILANLNIEAEDLARVLPYHARLFRELGAEQVSAIAAMSTFRDALTDTGSVFGITADRLRQLGFQIEQADIPAIAREFERTRTALRGLGLDMNTMLQDVLLDYLEMQRLSGTHLLDITVETATNMRQFTIAMTMAARSTGDTVKEVMARARQDVERSTSAWVAFQQLPQELRGAYMFISQTLGEDVANMFARQMVGLQPYTNAQEAVTFSSMRLGEVFEELARNVTSGQDAQEAYNQFILTLRDRTEAAMEGGIGPLFMFPQVLQSTVGSIADFSHMVARLAAPGGPTPLELQGRTAIEVVSGMRELQETMAAGAARLTEFTGSMIQATVSALDLADALTSSVRALRQSTDAFANFVFTELPEDLRTALSSERLVIPWNRLASDLPGVVEQTLSSPGAQEASREALAHALRTNLERAADRLVETGHGLLPGATVGRMFERELRVRPHVDPAVLAREVAASATQIDASLRTLAGRLTEFRERSQLTDETIRRVFEEELARLSSVIGSGGVQLRPAEFFQRFIEVARLRYPTQIPVDQLTRALEGFSSAALGVTDSLIEAEPPTPAVVGQPLPTETVPLFAGTHPLGRQVPLVPGGGRGEIETGPLSPLDALRLAREAAGLAPAPGQSRVPATAVAGVLTGIAQRGAFGPAFDERREIQPVLLRLLAVLLRQSDTLPTFGEALFRAWRSMEEIQTGMDAAAKSLAQGLAAGGPVDRAELTARIQEILGGLGLTTEQLREIAAIAEQTAQQTQGPAEERAYAAVTTAVREAFQRIPLDVAQVTQSALPLETAATFPRGDRPVARMLEDLVRVRGPEILEGRTEAAARVLEEFQRQGLIPATIGIRELAAAVRLAAAELRHMGQEVTPEALAAATLQQDFLRSVVTLVGRDLERLDEGAVPVAPPEPEPRAAEAARSIADRLAARGVLPGADSAATEAIRDLVQILLTAGIRIGTPPEEIEQQIAAIPERLERVTGLSRLGEIIEQYSRLTQNLVRARTDPTAVGEINVSETERQLRRVQAELAAILRDAAGAITGRIQDVASIVPDVSEAIGRIIDLAIRTGTVEEIIDPETLGTVVGRQIAATLFQNVPELRQMATSIGMFGTIIDEQRRLLLERAVSPDVAVLTEAIRRETGLSEADRTALTNLVRTLEQAGATGVLQAATLEDLRNVLVNFPEARSGPLAGEEVERLTRMLEARILARERERQEPEGFFDRILRFFGLAGAAAAELEENVAQLVRTSSLATSGLQSTADALGQVGATSSTTSETLGTQVVPSFDRTVQALSQLANAAGSTTGPLAQVADAVAQAGSTLTSWATGLPDALAAALPVPDFSALRAALAEPLPVPDLEPVRRALSEPLPVLDLSGIRDALSQPLPIPDLSTIRQALTEPLPVPDLSTIRQTLSEALPVPDLSGIRDALSRPLPVPDLSTIRQVLSEALPIPDLSGIRQALTEPLPVPDLSGIRDALSRPLPVPDLSTIRQVLSEALPIPDLSGIRQVLTEPLPVPDLSTIRQVLSEALPIPDLSGIRQALTEPLPVPDLSAIRQVLSAALPIPDLSGIRQALTEPLPVPDLSGIRDALSQPLPVPDLSGIVRVLSEALPVPDMSGIRQALTEPLPVPDLSAIRQVLSAALPIPDLSGIRQALTEPLPVPDLSAIRQVLSAALPIPDLSGIRQALTEPLPIPDLSVIKQVLLDPLPIPDLSGIRQALSEVLPVPDLAPVREALSAPLPVPDMSPLLDAVSSFSSASDTLLASVRQTVDTVSGVTDRLVALAGSLVSSAADIGRQAGEMLQQALPSAELAIRAEEATEAIGRIFEALRRRIGDLLESIGGALQPSALERTVPQIQLPPRVRLGETFGGVGERIAHSFVEQRRIAEELLSVQRLAARDLAELRGMLGDSTRKEIALASTGIEQRNRMVRTLEQISNRKTGSILARENDALS